VKITPNIFAIQTLVGNQYVILSEQTATLIDTGLPGNDRRILAEISSRGVHPGQLKHILITHADGDHFGSLRALQSYTSAETSTSLAEATAIRAGQSSRPLIAKNIIQRGLFRLTGKLFRSEEARIDIILEPGVILPVLNGLQVLDTTGHTPGHISFYLPEEKILFAGDSIWIKGGKLSPSSGANTWNVELARLAFERQMALNPKIIAAGHCIFFL